MNRPVRARNRWATGLQSGRIRAATAPIMLAGMTNLLSNDAPTDDFSQPTIPEPGEVEAMAEKVFGDLLGALSTSAISIGVALGWYEALAGARPLTSTELAVATDSDERYAREWLEQQAVSGYVTVVDADAGPLDRRFSLSPAAAEVLADRSSLSYMAPFPALVSAVNRSLDELIEVFRTGAGYGWHEHGDGARCGQGEANRPLFLQLLGQEYLASIPSVDEALRAGGRVADIGCGLGWSSIGVAQAYPRATVDGYDIDGPSVEMATANAAEAGVADRVRFEATDAGEVSVDRYDLVMALECVHDMPDPVSVLSAMRAMVKPDGTVLIMDERVGERFTGERDPVEEMFYGFSLLCCLADGRNAPTSVATGTVMRAPTLERYAVEAGFDGIEILPLENDFFRFYRLSH